MKRYLLTAAVAVAFFSASQEAQAQSQSKVKSGKLANTSVAPAAAAPEPEWPALETWNEPAAPASASNGWEAAATNDTDPMMQSSGVMVAPGMSSSPYRGTSTDYHGRPVAKPKSKRPRSVEVAQNDPMMQSSGVMIAPGMNTAPYRGTSTDYHGRPVRKPVANTTVSAQADVSQEPVAAGW
ncbi:hypothetical protein [Hymenobacter glacieicola]|uniref:Uncharacterized protein n=1 Tax=Hymenobacter glacieicola TaxID=1562124 RepID=A0ABQ1WN74_9BACT|nr:hypothetical protein [Hymenobacter glacieicola]GGG37510.1 hypothetical protein GCM10011378_12300 [Hymenobacter glacieicola]